MKSKKKIVKNIYSKYQKKHSRKKHNLGGIIGTNYNIVRLDRLDIIQYKRVSRIIIDMKKNDSIPLLGYWTSILFDILRKDGKTYIIYDKNIIIGIVLFKNLTYDFKSNMLRKKNVGEFKSKADINTYLIYYTFINSNNNMYKKLLDKILNIFINDNNLYNKNFILTLFVNLEYTNPKLDILNKYKPFVDFMFDGKKEYERLGFIYNGYHLTMHKEVFNVFSKRYLNKELSADDFYQTYIITRQLENYNAINVLNLETLFKNEGIYSLKNVYKFCIDNALVFYTNNMYNGIYSINKSVPYEFQFITNFITNELGNSHIICNYFLLHSAILNYYGENSKESKFFVKNIISRDEIYDLLDKKRYLYLRYFSIYTDVYIPYNQFNDKQKFIDFLEKEQDKFPNGFYMSDFTFVQNQIPLKNDSDYYFSQLLLFTYINNEFKAYCGITAGILIREYTFLDLYDDSYKDKRNYNYKTSIFPDDFANLTKEPISVNDVNKIRNKIIESCKIIAKMYKQYVCLEMNQINGYRPVHYFMRPIKVGNDYEIIVTTTTYFTLISNRHNLEQSEWYNEVAIKPALYKNYKTTRTEPHFQPLDLS